MIFSFKKIDYIINVLWIHFFRHHFDDDDEHRIQKNKNKWIKQIIIEQTSWVPK